tara:strand:- start:2213 stop:2503 length:291 start_codon:yes stop_codon:yes gene_type:complete
MLKNLRNELERLSRHQKEENRRYLLETIWDSKCYGYVLDRVIIITLFTKDQQDLPLLSKDNVIIITSYLLNDWKLEKINLMYKYEKDPDVVKYIME